MQLPSAIAPGRILARPRIRLPRPNEGATLALAALVVYIATSMILAFGTRFIDPDALSRVANAYYAVYSRDPHLAAIGFVWNPLPSLMMIPLLPLKFVVPELVESAYIATMFSVAFMSISVYVIWSILVDIGVRRWIRILFTVAFAVHPMIIEFGGNGMTEALFIMLLLLQAKFLARWVASGDLVGLVLAGTALGVAYLVRYEAAPVGIGTGLLVLAIAALRTPGSLRHRALSGVSDLIVYGLPLGVMFVLWAGVSWLIVGEPFEQFGSVYGTTSQLIASSVFGSGLDTIEAAAYATMVMFLLQPAFPIIMVAGVLVGLWHRDARVLAIAAVFGSVVAFAFLGYVSGKTGGWWRYYITLVPLTVLMAGFIVARPGQVTWPGSSWTLAIPTRWRPALPSPQLGRRAPRVSAAIAIGLVVALVVAVPTSLGATLDAFTGLGFRLRDGRIAYRQRQVQLVGTSRSIAPQIDALGLGEGEILLDVFLGFPIVLSSDDPRQFVITPDRDFESVLADPTAFGVEYLLVPPPDMEMGVLDAVNRAYPTMYADGAGMATLVEQFDSPVGWYWRLYRLNE